MGKTNSLTQCQHSLLSGCVTSYIPFNTEQSHMRRCIRHHKYAHVHTNGALGISVSRVIALILAY
jgi:hypothetical protein